jgi:hypothetical protein
MKQLHVAPLFIVFIFMACEPSVDIQLPKQTEGFVPIYSKDESVKTITAGSPRPVIKSGKIYTTGHLLFQVEPDSGIHIIDYTDPHHPQKISFIRSLFCKEIAVNNGFIYTNNFSDLVVIDIRDMNRIHETGRVQGVFPNLSLQYPPIDSLYHTIYFECPDPSKGVITGWKKQIINNPKCYR